MKIKLLIIFILFFISHSFTFSQVPNFPLGANYEIFYSKVVNVDSVSKELLYSKAKHWLKSYFNSYSEIVHIEDELNGIIQIKPKIEVYSNISGKIKIGYVMCSFKVQVKDGRYKYEMTDFWHVEPKLNTPGNILSKPPTESEDLILHYAWVSLQKQVYNYSIKLIDNFNSFMIGKKVNEEW